MLTFGTKDFRFLLHALVGEGSSSSASGIMLISTDESLPSLDFLELVVSTPEIDCGTLCFSPRNLFLFWDWLVEVASGGLHLSSVSKVVFSSFNWTDDSKSK